MPGMFPMVSNYARNAFFRAAILCKSAVCDGPMKELALKNDGLGKGLASCDGPVKGLVLGCDGP